MTTDRPKLRLIQGGGETTPRPLTRRIAITPSVTDVRWYHLADGARTRRVLPSAE